MCVCVCVFERVTGFSGRNWRLLTILRPHTPCQRHVMNDKYISPHLRGVSLLSVYLWAWLLLPWRMRTWNATNDGTHSGGTHARQVRDLRKMEAHLPLVIDYYLCLQQLQLITSVSRWHISLTQASGFIWPILLTLAVITHQRCYIMNCSYRLCCSCLLLLKKSFDMSGNTPVKVR